MKMPVSMFRILCLSGGILQEWEEVEAGDVLEALGARRAGQGCERIEVWCEGRRVAVLRPAGSDAVAAERVWRQGSG